MTLKVLVRPPRMKSHDGAMRRIGVEIEFAALSAEKGAHEVQRLLGGSIVQEDRHRFHVRGTSLGDFVCELDTQFAHAPKDADPAKEQQARVDYSLFEQVRSSLREFYGDISSVIVPCEIVAPPIPLEDLTKLELLVEVLERAGAVGTRASPLFAFGAQLNIEIAEGGNDWIVYMLKSYLLMSDWLRAVTRIDVTRRIASFADPFPVEYVAKVVDPFYWPDQNTLIDDYTRFNPTRNRELDMLPLFAWLDTKRVQRAVADNRIKARPAFHYRLPDANFGQSGWGFVLEWSRWLVVERLAEKRDLVNDMGAAYRANRGKLIPQDWALLASEWVMTA